MARTPEGRRIRRDLDKELESASAQAGVKLEFSASERAVLDLICDHFDRISDLKSAYQDAEEIKVRLALSTELRLLESSAARLLKQVRTDLPAPASKTSRRAQKAANTRWEQVRASGQ